MPFTVLGIVALVSAVLPLITRPPAADAERRSTCGPTGVEARA